MKWLALSNIPIGAIVIYGQWSGVHGEFWGLLAMSGGYVVFIFDWFKEEWL